MAEVTALDDLLSNGRRIEHHRPWARVVVDAGAESRRAGPGRARWVGEPDFAAPSGAARARIIGMERSRRGVSIAIPESNAVAAADTADS